MSSRVVATSNSRKTFGCGGNDVDADTSSITLVANRHSKTLTATSWPPNLAEKTRPNEPWPISGPRRDGKTCVAPSGPSATRKAAFKAKDTPDTVAGPCSGPRGRGTAATFATFCGRSQDLGTCSGSEGRGTASALAFRRGTAATCAFEDSGGAPPPPCRPLRTNLHRPLTMAETILCTTSYFRDSWGRTDGRARGPAVLQRGGLAAERVPRRVCGPSGPRVAAAFTHSLQESACSRLS